MRKKSFSNTHDQPKTWRQSAYQRGNQRESSPSYVLLYSDGDYSGDEENIPLSNANTNHRKHIPRKVEVIEVRLKSEDTLQALALRYGCSISEIKRINKIHTDNEIHARRMVKVPVPPFSVLTENVQKADEDVISRDSLVESRVNSSREDEIINLIATPIVSILPTPQTDINEIILRTAIEPVSCLETGDTGNEDTEHDRLLSNAESGMTTENVVDNVNFKCSGADWGISWLQLLGVSLLLGFAGPLIYILYLSTSSSKRRSTLGH